GDPRHRLRERRVARAGERGVRPVRREAGDDLAEPARGAAIERDVRVGAVVVAADVAAPRAVPATAVVDEVREATAAAVDDVRPPHDAPAARHHRRADVVRTAADVERDGRAAGLAALHHVAPGDAVDVDRAALDERGGVLLHAGQRDGRALAPGAVDELEHADPAIDVDVA